MGRETECEWVHIDSSLGWGPVLPGKSEIVSLSQASSIELMKIFLNVTGISIRHIWVRGLVWQPVKLSSRCCVFINQTSTLYEKDIHNREFEEHARMRWDVIIIILWFRFRMFSGHGFSITSFFITLHEYLGCRHKVYCSTSECSNKMLDIM